MTEGGGVVATQKRGLARWLAVILVLVLGSTACFGDNDDRPEVRKPFFDAVAALGADPVAHYKTSMGKAVQLDTRVTRNGDATGSITFAGQKLDFLAVDGKSFIRWEKGSLLGSVTADQADMVTGKWITGGTSDFPSPAAHFMTPQKLSETLKQALNRPGTKFPTQGTTAKIKGTAALKADTPNGDLYVTEKQPHRVLRWTASTNAPPVPSIPPPPSLPSLPSDMPSLPSLPDIPTLPSMPKGIAYAEKAGYRDVETTPPADALDTAMATELDVEDLSPEAVDATYDQLIERAEQLVDSFDTSYQANMVGDAAFTGCGPGACTITATLKTSFTSKNLQPVGQFNAVMNVTMTGDGRPAGGCSTTGTLPANGTGTLQCTNTSSAWNSYYTQAMRQRGAHVYVAQAVVLARGMAAPDVKKLVDRLKKDAKKADDELCGPGNSFPAGTLALMADGSHKPIESLKTGQLVRATDTETGDTNTRQVIGTHDHVGDQHLINLHIDVDGKGGEKLGAVTATEGHPFWLPDARTWVAAGRLKPGMWLRTSSGTWVQIAAVDRTTRHEHVYNLTVEDDHTYYVEAGDTPLLVHNCNTESVAADLAKMAYNGKTVGQAVRINPDGSVTKLGQPLISGQSSLAEKVNQALKESGVKMPSNGKYPAAEHPDTQFAYLLGQSKSGVASGDIVITKVGGTCGGEYSCPIAIRKLLPTDWKLRVHSPIEGGGMHVQEFIGE